MTHGKLVESSEFSTGLAGMPGGTETRGTESNREAHQVAMDTMQRG